MKLSVHRLDAARKEDFYRLQASFELPDHSEVPGGWCFCAAWWLPTWDGWSDRKAEENKQVREGLCDRGEFDGYLVYADGEPAGWCQAGPRDRLAKLTRQFALAPEPGTWAISCFMIAPKLRRKGLARFLLTETLADLKRRGAQRVEVYPKRGDGLDEGDLWTGPEALYREAGFQVRRDDPKRPVLSLELKEAPVMETNR